MATSGNKNVQLRMLKVKASLVCTAIHIDLLKPAAPPKIAAAI